MSSVNKTKYEQEIATSISGKDWKKLASICEEFELDVAAEVSNVAPNYGVHLLAYLLLNDQNLARFLWKRIPSSVKSSKPEYSAIWKIGQAMWTKNYPEFYKALVGFNWTDAHRTLVQQLGESFRNTTFMLLSRAFTLISPQDASVYLGLTQADTLKLTGQQGWVLDQKTNMIKTKPIPTGQQEGTSLVQLQQLTEYFCYLESQ